MDRFGQCMKCPSIGLACQNESVNLKPGFYWKWESGESRKYYENFTAALQVQANMFGSSFEQFVSFNGSFPKAYACPVKDACLGGMESPCSEGYEGPLCAVCSEGYYQMISTCQKCPTLPWLIGQILLATLLLTIVVLPLLIGKKLKSTSGRSITDIVLARFKIFIGFYQVASGTLDAFSYVQWPKLLLQLTSYAKLLQLNLLQIAPVNCFTNQVHTTIYTSFLLSVVTLVAAFITFFAYFYIRWLYLNKAKRLRADDLKNCFAGTKETSYRYTFLIMFIVYPTVSSQVLQILPPSCQTICVDSQENSCQSFLKSDYYLECFTNTHHKFANVAYAFLTFVVGFPLVTLFLLWKYHHSEGVQDGNTMIDENKRNEISAGLSFLYENYSDNCWFWEVLELVRKIILTSVLVFLGGESRTSLGVAAIMSGLYTILFASYQPISDRFEHWLQLMSLLATVANMNVGMLLKIPEENISSGVKTELEGTAITVLLVSVNLLVTGMIAGEWISLFFYPFTHSLNLPNFLWHLSGVKSFVCHHSPF